MGFPESRDWTTYEAKPAGSDNLNVGDDEIRATKVDIRQRMAIDHVWGDTVNTDGLHNKCSLTYQAADPATSTGIGFV